MVQDFKKSKFKLISIIIFALGFLFLMVAIFVYTPWFKNSHWYKVYQAQKTLDGLPAGSQAQKAQAAYVQCLKSNQTKCQIGIGSSPTGPGPGMSL